MQAPSVKGLPQESGQEGRGARTEVSYGTMHQAGKGEGGARGGEMEQAGAQVTLGPRENVITAARTIGEGLELEGESPKSQQSRKMRAEHTHGYSWTVLISVHPAPRPPPESPLVHLAGNPHKASPFQRLKLVAGHVNGITVSTSPFSS